VQHWFCELLDPEVGALFEGACATLEASGFTLVPVSLPGMEEHVAACARAIVRHEVFPALCADLGQRGRPMAPAEILARVASPDVKNALRGALDCDPAESARDHAAALTLHRPALAALFAEVFVRHALDALLFPTLPVPPPPLGVNMLEVAGRGQAVFGLLVRNVQPASLAALPSISLPMGYTRSGLPVGVELDGAHGQDDALLEVAAAVEAALAVPRRAPLVGFADTP
jgi:mandelamide amidase